MKRIFIAINLPKEIKESLVEKQEDIKVNFTNDSIIRWVQKDNLHITLSFLGLLKEKELKEIIKLLNNVKVSEINVCLQDIKYVPSRGEAKMIWATGQSRDLKNFKKEIETLLGNFIDKRSSQFKLHITLGRVKSFEFKKTSLEEIPLLEDEFIDKIFTVHSFEIMESNTKKGKPNYEIIKTFK